jgi:hypothetical protein
MNQAGRKFVEANGAWGPAINQPDIGRGTAYGDFDNDGDLDILINNLDGSPTLLRNDGGNQNSWLMVQCEGTVSNRSAIGTRLIVRTGGSQQTREIKAGSGYASHNDIRVHFGLGSLSRVDELEIRWPSGRVQKLASPVLNQLLKVVEPRS